MPRTKVVADTLPKADKVLSEVLNFMEVAQTLCSAVAPYSIASEGRMLPRFIAETSTEMKNNLVKDFAIYFPNLQELVEDGTGSGLGVGRLHDACYVFNQAQQAIYKAGCVLKGDEEREAIYEKLHTVIGDIAVFVCIQFGLYHLDTGEVQLAISKHCERCRITPEVFYGVMQQTLQDVERSWWAYEVISPMYTALNDFDPTFVSECEESMYPLTDEMAKRIVEGELDVAEARGTLVEHMKTLVETDVDVTPATLISQMRLK